jgi:hypothetical protein
LVGLVRGWSLAVQTCSTSEIFGSRSLPSYQASRSTHRESRHDVANVTEINGFAYFIIAKHGDFCVEIAWRLVTLMSLRFLTNNILGGNHYNYVPETEFVLSHPVVSKAEPFLLTWAASGFERRLLFHA